jgi:hypothetical protein
MPMVDAQLQALFEMQQDKVHHRPRLNPPQLLRYCGRRHVPTICLLALVGPRRWHSWQAHTMEAEILSIVETATLGSLSQTDTQTHRHTRAHTHNNNNNIRGPIKLSLSLSLSLSRSLARSLALSR